MFLERVPVHPMIGRTAEEFLAQYGIPAKHLNAVFGLPQNRSLRDGIMARAKIPRIELTTDLVRSDPSSAPGGSTILLPVGAFQVKSRRDPIVNYQGLRAQSIQGGQINKRGFLEGGRVLNQAFLQTCTHGLKVDFDRESVDGWNPLPCNRIRWVQTVKKINDPHKGLVHFVDGGGTVAGGESFPWYHIGVNPDPLSMTDTPCGPEARTAATGLQFSATTSLAVWTGKRITLIRSFAWGFAIHPGKDKTAIRPSPEFRPADDNEIGEHLRILRLGLGQRPGDPPHPTGSNLIYRPPPADGTINQGL